MAEFASVSDLEKRWRKLSGHEVTLADQLLEDACVRLRVLVDVDEDDAEQGHLLEAAACEMVRHSMEAHGDAFGVPADANDFQAWMSEYPAGDLWLSNQTKVALGIGQTRVSCVRASRG